MSSGRRDGWDWGALALRLAISLAASGCQKECSDLTIKTTDGTKYQFGDDDLPKYDIMQTAFYKRSGDAVEITEITKAGGKRRSSTKTTVEGVETILCTGFVRERP